MERMVAWRKSFTTMAWSTGRTFGLSALALLLCLAQLQAQDLGILQHYKEKHPDERVVMLMQEQEYDISKQGTELKILSTTHDRALNLSPQGASPKEKVTYNSFMDLVDIEAYTMVPETKKYRKVPVKEFSEKDELSTSIFHDDVRSTSFIFPTVAEGCITDMRYTLHIKEPHYRS